MEIYINDTKVDVVVTKKLKQKTKIKRMKIIKINLRNNNKELMIIMKIKKKINKMKKLRKKIKKIMSKRKKKKKMRIKNQIMKIIMKIKI